jgi:hypothetical protein
MGQFFPWKPALGGPGRAGGESRGSLHVYVSPPPDPNIRDDELVELADEERHRLEVALRSRVSEHLGPEFDAEISDVRPGSVEIVALILLVGSLVGSYNTVREGLRNLREDWRTLVGAVLNPHVPYWLKVEAFYRLGPVMETLPTGPEVAMAQSPTSRVMTRQPIELPGWFLKTAAVLLFLVLLGWLVVPLLLVAGAL